MSTGVGQSSINAAYLKLTAGALRLFWEGVQGTTNCGCHVLTGGAE